MTGINPTEVRASGSDDIIRKRNTIIVIVEGATVLLINKFSRQAGIGPDTNLTLLRCYEIKPDLLNLCSVHISIQNIQINLQERKK